MQNIVNLFQHSSPRVQNQTRSVTENTPQTVKMRDWDRTRIDGQERTRLTMKRHYPTRAIFQPLDIAEIALQHLIEDDPEIAEFWIACVYHLRGEKQVKKTAIILGIGLSTLNERIKKSERLRTLLKAEKWWEAMPTNVSENVSSADTKTTTETTADTQPKPNKRGKKKAA